MSEKVVVLTIGDGSFEQGFPVTLQFWQAGDRPATEVTGKLPPAAEMPLYYQRWQTTYRSLGLRSLRLSAPKSQVTNVSRLEDCQTTAQILRARFNTWLCAEEFRAIREKWLERLQPHEPIRLLLKTNHPDLQRLPWHLWDVLERYPQAELALCAPSFEQVEPLPTTPKVKILAILGNSDGIDTQTDLALLQALPDAEVTLLSGPSRRDLTDRLWGQCWDILFFAGHSATQRDGHTGCLFINQTDSLTISELKYALRQAVKRGLRLAIFNSCDGLALARELADLHIPEVIVMREPVPDRVAQAFLHYFLTDYAQGESLYRAVRQARERLQGLEDQFPCATWLPVIFQNPAEVPPTWRTLAGQPEPIAIAPRRRLPRPAAARTWRTLPWVVGSSLAVTVLLMGTRHLGAMQGLELQAFDQLMRLRPAENPDSRLLLVTVTEEDVQAQPADQRRGSLSDKALHQLLAKLEAYQPRVIGLDIYRDYPVKPEFRQLAQRMQQSDRFVATCRVSNSATNQPGIAPPPEVAPDRLGFADLEIDPDQVMRRQLLAMSPPPASPCATAYSFSLQLALRYLAAEGIQLEVQPDGTWQIGRTRFKPLEAHSNGYQTIDAWGHQILLNYRNYRSVEDFADRITLGQVLAGKLNASAVKNRIVLIGTTADSFKDFFSTPFTSSPLQQTPGVIVQAQMVSQLVSAVLDQRLLLATWSAGAEFVWVAGWALVGGLLAWVWRRLPWLLLAAAGAIVLLCLLCFGLLLEFGWWVPLVPAGVAFCASCASSAAFHDL